MVTIGVIYINFVRCGLSYIERDSYKKMSIISFLCQ